MNSRTSWKAARHEAGHAVAFIAAGSLAPKIKFISASREHPRVQLHSPLIHRGDRPDQMRWLITCCLAGPAADAVLNHIAGAIAVLGGGMRDYEMAMSIYTDLVACLGAHAESFDDLDRNVVTFVRRQRRAIEALASILRAQTLVLGEDAEAIVVPLLTA